MFYITNIKPTVDIEHALIIRCTYYDASKGTISYMYLSNV